MAIATLRKRYPNRHIIYLNRRDSWREREAFNMDILKDALTDKCALEITYFDSYALLSLDGYESKALFERLIVRCAIVASLGDDGVQIYTGGSTCDIMSAICRILKEFEK